jgi:outer membrane protein TolC
LPGALFALTALSPLALPGQAAPQVVTLEDALARFHRSSPALALARNRLRAESAASRQGTALPNPVAAFSNEDLGDYSERYLTLSQRVDFLWEASGRGRRADARTLRAHARFQADSAGLVREVKEAYARAWEGRERTEVLRRADGLTASLSSSASMRFAEGDLAGYDVRRLEVERARVARRLAEVQIEQAVAEGRLAALVGETEGARLTAAPLDGPAPPLPVGFDAVDVALSRRPELAAARAAVEEQRAEVGLARSSMLSGTAVGAGLKRQSDGRDGLFLEVQLPVPILDRKGAAVEAARATVAGAESEVAWVERMVAMEASLARARLDAALRVAELVGGRGLAEAEELLAIARVAYGEGEVGIVEMVDASEAFTEAGLQGIGARAAAWQAYFELEQAVGGITDDMQQGGER